jgi:hypothetical protein
MNKFLLLIFLVFILNGCIKTTCISHSPWTNKCEKVTKIDWKDPRFTMLRTIITNGASLGK